MGKQMAFSEALLAYHDTPVGPNLTTLAELMNGYHLWPEFPTLNLSSDCNVQLPEK